MMNVQSLTPQGSLQGKSHGVLTLSLNEDKYVQVSFWDVTKFRKLVWRPVKDRYES